MTLSGGPSLQEVARPPSPGPRCCSEGAWWSGGAGGCGEAPGPRGGCSPGRWSCQTCLHCYLTASHQAAPTRVRASYCRFTTDHCYHLIVKCQVFDDVTYLTRATTFDFEAVIIAGVVWRCPICTRKSWRCPICTRSSCATSPLRMRKLASPPVCLHIEKTNNQRRRN